MQHVPLTKVLPLILVLLAVIYTASCQPFEADRLVDEGNSLVQASQQPVREFNAKLSQLASAYKAFPVNREQLQSVAQETITSSEDAVTKLRQASERFNEASRLEVDGEYKKYQGYWSLEAQKLSKFADQLEVGTEFPKAILDRSINDFKTLDVKYKDITSRVEKALGELKALNEQSAKYKQENSIS